MAVLAIRFLAAVGQVSLSIPDGPFHLDFGYLHVEGLARAGDEP